jgi:hypothetical protein
LFMVIFEILLVFQIEIVYANFKYVKIINQLFMVKKLCIFCGWRKKILKNLKIKFRLFLKESKSQFSQVPYIIFK